VRLGGCAESCRTSGNKVLWQVALCSHTGCVPRISNRPAPAHLLETFGSKFAGVQEIASVTMSIGNLAAHVWGAKELIGKLQQKRVRCWISHGWHAYAQPKCCNLFPRDASTLRGGQSSPPYAMNSRKPSTTIAAWLWGELCLSRSHMRLVDTTSPYCQQRSM
jgi:hypothetical protein